MSASDYPEDHLPPPAFPSGIGRGEDPLPEEVLISPEAPIEREPRLHDALTLPDAPVIRTEPVRTPEDFERVMDRPLRDEAGGSDEVEVTGVGAGALTADREEALLAPGIERLVTELEALAGALRRKGEPALRSEPVMTRFEITLRGYCTGYLAALRDSAIEADIE